MSNLSPASGTFYAALPTTMELAIIRDRILCLPICYPKI